MGPHAPALGFLWAVDGSGRVWKDGAHGPPLEEATPEDLLGDCETDEDRENVSAALGRGKPMPEWMKQALASGWTPPAD